MADDTNTQPGDAGADPSVGANSAAPTPEPTSAPSAAPAADPVVAASTAPATAIAPDGVFVDGAGLVEHPDLPAPKNFLQELEAEVIAAEKAGMHKAHAALNDIHLLLTQVKAKARDALEHLEGDACDMVSALHRGL